MTNKLYAEAIYTFKNGEQAFTESAKFDFTSEESARQSVLKLLKRVKETRELAKVSFAIQLHMYYEHEQSAIMERLKWFSEANGKLYF